MWWKYKTLLYVCGQLHYSCKNDDIYKDIAEDLQTKKMVSEVKKPKGTKKFKKKKT